MKIIALIINLLFIINHLFCQDLRTYSPILVKNILIGDGAGSIGWEKPVGGSETGPSTFIIKNNKIVIPDLINARINVYDMEFNIVNTIIEQENKIAIYARKILLDKENNIYSVNTTFGLIKIDTSGSKIFILGRDELPVEMLAWKNIFIIDDIIVFYDDKNR